MLRENPLDFFETEGVNHLHTRREGANYSHTRCEGASHQYTRCDRHLADINVIINENGRGHVMVEWF